MKLSARGIHAGSDCPDEVLLRPAANPGGGIERKVRGLDGERLRRALHAGKKPASVGLLQQPSALRVAVAAETDVLAEISAISRVCSSGWGADGYRGPWPQEKAAEPECEAGALPHLVVNRQEALEIAGDRKCVLVGHLVKPLVRHHWSDQSSIPALAIPQRPNDLRLAPCTEASTDIGRQIAGACDADPPVPEFLPAAEWSIGIVLRPSRVTAAANRYTADDVLAAGSRSCRIESSCELREGHGVTAGQHRGRNARSQYILQKSHPWLPTVKSRIDAALLRLTF